MYRVRQVKPADLTSSVPTRVKHAVRQREIDRFNASIICPRCAALQWLPDDVLFIILEFVNCESKKHLSDANQHRPGRKDVQHLSMVNKRFRHFITPHLFRRVSSRRDWTTQKFTQAIKALQHSNIAPYIQHIRIDVSFPQTLRNNNTYSDIASLGPLIPRVLSKLPHLSTLTLETALDTAATLRTSILKTNIPILHTITHLKINLELDCLLPFCPQLTHLDLQNLRSDDEISPLFPYRSSEQLVYIFLTRSSPHLHKLQHFSLATYWNEMLLRRVLGTMPNLRSLGMYDQWYREKFSKVLEILKEFGGKKLKRLGVISALRLEGFIEPVKGATTGCVEHDGMYGCHKAQAAMVMVFRELRGVEEVRIGDDFRARCVAGGGRERVLQWETGVWVGEKWVRTEAEYELRIPPWGSLIYGMGCGHWEGMEPTSGRYVLRESDAAD